MSVAGEFRRCLHGCVDQLRGSPEPAARELARELRGAEERARDDLSAAAEYVLELCDPARAGALFESDGDGRAFRDHAEHLRELCRAIAGRS